MSYLQGKERARQKAIDWQYDFANRAMSWDELSRAQAYFEKLGRRYGLLREFRVNDIC